MAKHLFVIFILIFTLSVIAITSTQLNSENECSTEKCLERKIKKESKRLCSLQKLKVRQNMQMKITSLRNTIKEKNDTYCIAPLRQNKAEISLLKTNITVLQTSLDEQKNYSEYIQSIMQTKENKYNVLQNQYTELHNLFDIKDIEIKQLNTTQRSLLDQLNNKTSMIIELKNTIQDMQALIKNKKNDYALLLDNYTELHKEVELKDIEISTLRSNNITLFTELQSCTNEKINLVTHLTEMTNSLKDVTTTPQNTTKSQATEGKCPPFGNFTGDHLVTIPGFSQPFRIPCNSDSNKKDWTVIERRLKQTLDFNRNWESYRNGFGDHKSEFFIGLKLLNLMTSSQQHELLIRLRSRKTVKFAHYSDFEVSGEDKNFQLKSLGLYSGDAGDGMRESEGLKFSTFDRDNDLTENSNCAKDSGGAWWFTDCGVTNLNFKYYSKTVNQMLWNNLMEPVVSIEMMIRPTELDSNNK
ncbi:angiopoietin-related protein 4-like [Drosophila innubila]|uniref:angiopoietin-related protein 4-like n=1 Tax=Drosophila innubila TaxID=198719 RepID=UPI00148DF819|nr:angiopoietin-related protein 4-like [Drosophila innubila]